MLSACNLSKLRSLTAARLNLKNVHIFESCSLFSSKKGGYSHTLKMLKTDFPISSHNSIYERESEIQKKFEFDKLYEWQSKQDQPNDFVLHDGPPYANGDPHIGHTLNKILKDITNRYKLLTNHKISYVPGWDCHGMPIEQKALENISDEEHLNPVAIRKLAQEFAKKTCERQNSIFRNWGIMADWDNGCYHTYNPKFESQQLEVFFNLHEKGLIYQQYMPVFWSASTKSALAEAEIEYKNDFVSTEVFFKFPLVKLPANWTNQVLDEGIKKVYAVIWTTTPWTLPLNKSICYGEGIRYCLLKDEETGDGYIVSEKAAELLCTKTEKNLTKVLDFQGSELKASTYLTLNGVEAPVVFGKHVTTNKGTGLVHCAPAHGVEDFQVALKNNLSVECNVDGEGKYDSTVGHGLAGKFVLTEGSKEVLNIWSQNVLYQSKYKHRYPVDWRTKKPLFYRASLQWFFNTNKIKEQAFESLENVKFHPEESVNGMVSELRSRNYWCISRQRSWGVPIPVFKEKASGKILLSRHSIDHLKELFAKHGSDCWWKMSTEELLPKDVIEKSGFDREASFEQGKDILDIWFDSGITWHNVLEGGKDKVADVYLEGKDQYGGWYMTSLLTSTALQGKAPFKKLLTHGFTMDKKGKKMSKSLNNVIEPHTVIEGTKKKPGHGIDSVRIWAAQAGLKSEVLLSDAVLTDVSNKLFKFRKTLRFLIGCLHDFKLEDAQLDREKLKQLHLNDRYLLHLLHKFTNETTRAYEDFNFSHVVNLSNVFNVNDVSAFYFHILKDRLYCGNSEDRHSSQVALFHILDVLTKALAPITPHLSEETYLHHPLSAVGSSIFKTRKWLTADWSDPDLASVYEKVLPIRDALNGLVKLPAEFDVDIYADKSVMKNLEFLHGDGGSLSFSTTLGELLQTARVNLHPLSEFSESSAEVHNVHKGNGYSLVAKKSESASCLRCRRYVAPVGHELCQRCSDMIGSHSASSASL